MNVLKKMLLGALVSFWSVAACSAEIVDVDGAGSTTVDATVTLLAIPEPSTFALLGLGVLGLIGLRRKRG